MPRIRKHSYDLLLLELKNGNEKAFRQLFELLWEPLFLKAKSLVLDDNIAKDIVQGIWVNLWEKRECRDIKNLEAYLFRSVTNNCYKYFRDNKFTATHLINIESLELPLEPQVVQQHDFEEIKIIVDKTLQKLPPRCQQIFKLSRYEKTSNEEIANLLGISKRSVENQISTALKSLRQNLAATSLIIAFFLSHFF